MVVDVRLCEAGKAVDGVGVVEKSNCKVDEGYMNINSPIYDDKAVYGFVGRNIMILI